MGNSLVGIAPSQIFPLEHYMADIAELHLEKSLGSTRFLKVGRARMRDSPDMQIVVVKGFAVHDLGIDLLGYRDRLLEVKRKLEGCLNCLPFQRVWVSVQGDPHKPTRPPSKRT